MVERCKKCGVVVNNINKHLARNRCEAVKFRREWRKEIKADTTIGKQNSLGARGTRTKKRNNLEGSDK